MRLGSCMLRRELALAVAPRDGVAALVPHPHTVVESRVIVSGRVLEVTVAINGSERRVACVCVNLLPA